MRIRSITKTPPRKVFAIGTSTGTFISDGLAHHNCYSCNIHKKGNTVEYYDFMLKTYGEDVIQELREKDKIIEKWFVYEYDALNDILKEKIKEMS